MGNWYRVIKTIKGNPYLYEQQTFREGGRVRTRSRYLGPANRAKGEKSFTGKAAVAGADAVFLPAHRKITDAYPENFLGINMAWLAQQAKASGYNLSDALIRRVDSTADLGRASDWRILQTIDLKG